MLIAVFGRRLGALVNQGYMLAVMCGRSTYKLTWEEVVALYRLTLDQHMQGNITAFLQSSDGRNAQSSMADRLVRVTRFT